MSTQNLTIELSAKVLGEYDVIVCGGGTAGCIAALAAARNDAKVLLLEAGYYLGGMLTQGNAGLTKYVMHGVDPEEQYKINQELAANPENVQVAGGIPLEITNALIASGDALGNYGTGASYVYPDVHAFKIYLFDALRDAGVKILLHSQVIQVIKNGSHIDGIVYLNKEGTFIAYSKYVIDTTGDGDVSALAGVEYYVGSSEHDSVVKDGLIPVGVLHNPGSMYRIGGVDFDKLVNFLKENPEKFQPHMFGHMSLKEFLESYEKGEAIETFCQLGEKSRFQIYNNPRKGIMVGCISVSTGLNGLIADELTQAEYEVLTVCSDQLSAIKKEYPGFEHAFIVDVPPAGIRETRHIMGEYLLTIRDILTNRDFEDSIGRSSHPVDIYPIPNECRDITPPARAWFRVPYRSLVAKGIDNLLLAGRLISATREASGCTRPTICCMVTGEAAGTAAALLSESGGAAKDINVNLLRETLKNNNVKC